jgi:predicted porin
MRLPANVVCAVAWAAASVAPLQRAGAETASSEAKQEARLEDRQQAKSDQAQVDALKRQVEELTRRLDALAAQPKAAQPPAASGTAVAPIPVAAQAAAPAQAPAGDAKPKGSFAFYGYLDLAADYATKGLSGRTQSDGTIPVGNMGWQAAIGSNSSYVGVRGGHELGTPWLSGLFQLETQVDVSATPGYANANYFGDSRVMGALASRNSFLGLSGPWGAVKAGKSDTPYYLATRRMDPFYGTVGTFTSIMGNSGGDNRVEFGYRMPHAIWYESPSWNGLAFSGLVSPGQNRNNDNLIQPAGEPNCSGYYVPGIVNPLCNDGAFGTAYSLAGRYEMGPLYAAAAWELHRSANRTVDEAANGGASPDGSIGLANEWALKFAAEYTFPTHTTVGAIYEKLGRHNPYVSQDFNERDRFSTWVEVVQKVTPGDDAYFGWAHAGKTPGDVGTRRADGSTAAGPVDNVSNMYAFGFKHHFLDGRPSVYVVYARQVNHDGAHYDLGAGSHGIQYDCHDAGPDAPNSANTGIGPPNAGNVPFPFGGGRCFAGATLQAASVGMTFSF